MFVVILLLATIFGPIGPSLGQNLQKKLKMLVHIVHKYQIYWIPFTFINRFYNYNQLLDVLFVVSCAEILYTSTMDVLP